MKWHIISKIEGSKIPANIIGTFIVVIYYEMHVCYFGTIIVQFQVAGYQLFTL